MFYMTDLIKVFGEKNLPIILLILLLLLIISFIALHIMTDSKENK